MNSAPTTGVRGFRVWQTLVCFGLEALTGCAGATHVQEFSISVPTMTVEEWARCLRSTGRSRDLLGLKVIFNAKVTVPGARPTVRILETEEALIGNAHLHNVPTNDFQVGDLLEVEGILVDNPYSFWWIWTSRVEYVDADRVSAADGAAPRR